ncbi:hypothetical protein LINGRAHAP2_LOCUS15737 [Linum grandiflorum]
MRMVFRLQSICLQEHSPIRNHTIQLESSPLNESKMLCLGELSLNSHTLEDLCSGFKEKNMYTLILNPNCNMPYKETILGKGNCNRPYKETILGKGLSWLLSYLKNYNTKRWNWEYMLHY